MFRYGPSRSAGTLARREHLISGLLPLLGRKTGKFSCLFGKFSLGRNRHFLLKLSRIAALQLNPTSYPLPHRALLNGQKAAMQIVILKSDRLSGHTLRQAMETMFPEAEISLFRWAREALGALRRAPAELALLDTQTEDMDGLDHIPAIIQSGLARHTLVLLGRSDERTFAELRRLQCDALVDADSADVAELQHALGEIAARRHYTSASLVRLQTRNLVAYNPHLLTPHEELALSVMGEGSDDEEVAERLVCSPETVRTHRGHIMRKLDLHHKGELMRYAIGQSYVRFTSSGILHPGFEHRLSECRKSMDPDLASATRT